MRERERTAGPVRFGVVGLRRGQSFVRVCRAVGGAVVAALYDVDAPRAARAAAEIDARAFESFESFLNADIDAVVIASPLPYHARQAAAALAAGKHVLSEVTACDTLDDARELVRAARASRALYMLAENYRYLDEVELLKRLHDDGRFGELYYGEGEYIHDCRGLWYDEAGALTWRGRGGLGVYCTHSLGPLLYITGQRVTSVSALAVPGGKFDPRVSVSTMHLMQMTTEGGVTLRVRVDHVSPRPHQMAYYALQGTRGSYEAWRGFGDASKIWLEDEHPPSLFHTPAQWHALAGQAPRYIPDRLAAPPEARSGGHGTSEYWLLQDFLAAVHGLRPSPIDVYRGLDYTLPGICAVESALAGGAPVAVPNPRDW
jgi:predicted dehydrogenase